MKEVFVIEVFGCADDTQPVEVIVCKDSKECQYEQFKLYETLPEGCAFTVHRKVVNE